MTANPPTYPACFVGLTLEQVNYHLLQGYATKADAAQYVEWWNRSGKRLTVATLREKVVTLGRVECLAPYITIAD